MTILIPDSWELPSYLAGDVVNMDNYRDRERATVPDKDRAPGQNARIFDLDYTRSMKTPPQPLVDLTPDWDAGRSHMETYDPSKDEPAELYNQDDLDALHDAGFHPTESGVWHRPVTNDKGENLGASHTIIYEPGHRQTSDGRLIPWHVMSDQEGIGTAHPTLHGALNSVNAEAERVRKMPRHSRLYTPGVKMAVRSPGRANADDWLEQNTPESFEEDSRAAARDWMDQNAHEYDEWHPDPNDYTYSDVGDAAGQRFDEHGEARPIAMPGHFREENAALNESRWSPADLEDHERLHDHHPDLRPQPEPDEDDEDEEFEADPEDEALASHGFNWRVNDHAGDGPSGTRAEWVKKQHDLNGHHIATHTLYKDARGKWNVESGPSDTSNFLTSNTSHGHLDFALLKYKQNSAEALLPQHGYEPVPSRANGVHFWTKTDPSPEGHHRPEDYQHEIMFPESGFAGNTINHTHLPNGSLFAPHGAQSHSSEELADVVREQQRLSAGVHPGGRQDFRLTPSELHADPTVSRLGRPVSTHTPWGDHKVGRMTWRLPSPPHGRDLPVNAEANYNWNTGDYDFKYTHDGTTLAATHNYVPDGAPVTIPGRQTQLPLESAR